MKKFFLTVLVLLVSFCLFAEDVRVSTEGFVEYPASWKKLSKEERDLQLINLLTSISTQEGIQYISRMAGYKPKTLLEKSYCISDVNDKKSKIADPVFNSVPSKYTLYAFQQDNRFGGNTFVIDYVCADDITLKIVNHTALRFAGNTCVQPNGLTMTLKIEQTETGFKVTGDAFAPNQKAKVNLLFYTVDLESSFNRRITALQNWFIDQVNNF